MDSFSRRVFLLAFLVRLVPVLLAINLGIGLDDMFQYDMLARSLAAGNGFRWYAEPDRHLIEPYIRFDTPIQPDPRGVETSFRAPLYPAFLAVIYLISGLETRFFAARLTQAALGALLAPLTYALARRVFPDDARVARIASLGIALYPMLLLYPLALATENLFFVLVLGSVVALLRAGTTQRARDFALAGILLGLAALTRSIILAFVPFALFWVWHCLRNPFSPSPRSGAEWGLRKRVSSILLIAACIAVLTLPWIIRNSLLHQRFTSIESSMGYNLYLGYHPQGTGTFQFGISLDLLKILDDAERDQKGTQAALTFIQQDPARVPYLIAHKLGYFFGLERRALTYFYSNNFFGYIPLPLLLIGFLVFTLPFVIIAPLAAIGLTLSRWTRENALIVLLFIAYIVPHALIMAEDRFHLTLVPFLAVYAAYALVHRHELWSRARSLPARGAVVLALCLIAFLFLNWGLELARDADKLALLFSPTGNTAGFSY